MIPFVLLLQPAGAAVLSVGPNGSYATVNDALAAAAPGDELVVEPGLYAESVTVSVDVTITGAGSSLTILSSPAGPTLTARRAVVALQGLQLTGPDTALDVEATAAVLATDLALQDNGGDMVVVRGHLDLAESAFTGAGTGRALRVRTGGSLVARDLTVAGYHSGLLNSGDATVITSAFSGNGLGVESDGETLLVDVDVTDAGEVGVYVFGDLTMLGGTVSECRQPNLTGSAVTVAYGHARFDGTTFRNNLASLGGAWVVADASAVCTRCTFEGNESLDNGGAVFGQVPSRLVFRDTSFIGNHAWRGGGAIDAVDELVVVRSQFCGNTATTTGGAVQVGAFGPVRLTNVLFAENSAPEGGGLAASGPRRRVRLQNTTFLANHATSGLGDAISNHFGDLSVGSTIIAGHAGIAVEGTALTRLDHVLWFDNGTDIAGGPTGPNDVFADPEFLSWTADGDCTNDVLLLGPTSPARDAGLPQVQFLDRDGSVNDIGHTGGPQAAP